MIAAYADRIKGDSNREKMMNKYVMTLIGIFCTTAVAAEDINETMDADARSAVHISNIAGSVEVSGWSRNEVELSGELGSGVEELIFERDGDEIIIQVRARQHNSRNISSDLVVKVPKLSSLRINTVSADIEIDNVEGEQRLQSVSGDIETSAFAEDIEVESVSGDVEVDGDGKAMRSRFNTVSGDIETEKLSGEIADIYYGFSAPHRGLPDEAYNGCRRFPLSIPVDSYDNGNGAAQTHHFEILKNWSKPVHFIWGIEDEIFTESWGREWADRMGASFDPIAGASHFLQNTHGRELAECILARIEDT